MNKTIDHPFHVFVCGALILQLMGCGTILYPERKGQRSGRIDVGVALLDGIGLFFFLIPGVIAYVVDFSNGTIYLPGTSMSSLDMKNIRQVKFDPKHMSLAGIESIIKAETGYSVKMNQSNLRITKLNSSKEIMTQFAQVMPDIANNRVALIR